MSCFNNIFSLKRPELVEYIERLNSNIKLTGLNKSELLCLIMKLKTMRLPDNYILNEKDLRCFNDYGKTKVSDLKAEIKKYVPSMKLTGLKKADILCILFDLFTKKKMIPEKEYILEPRKTGKKKQFSREEWWALQKKNYEAEMKRINKNIERLNRG
jgi:hypothetical protein